jgi:hypothetical protein
MFNATHELYRLELRPIWMYFVDQKINEWNRRLSPD